MAILAFDIGGTAVKYGVFQNGILQETSSFLTPETWAEMKAELLKVKTAFSKNIDGIAISSPGSVDSETGIIHGISAIPYIHHFPIVAELEQLFQLPVSIENDANCAGLAEVAFGVAKEVQNAAFFIVGSGVGGAVIINRQLLKGKNLFGGEFGYMLLSPTETLSPLASPVQTARHYSELAGLPTAISGKELFALADEGNEEAQEAVSGLYDALARGIYNVLMVLDPDIVAIGGGISQRVGLRKEVAQRVVKLLEQTGAMDLKFQLEICQFQNNANLLGAVSNFLNQKGTKYESEK